MNPPPIPSQDAEHLRVLALCHYVYGAFLFAGCLVSISAYFMFSAIVSTVSTEARMSGGSLSHGPEGRSSALSLPEAFSAAAESLSSWQLALFTCLLVASLLPFVSARFIQRRVNRTFSLVVAGMLCLMFPIGTVLGVFTLIILTRLSVRRLYEPSAALPA